MLHQSRILFVKRNKPLDKWCIKREERKKRNKGMNYRQLKTKGVLATKTAIRAFLGNTLCYLPYIGWVPKPSRKNGISVMIRTRNEEE